MFVAELKGKRPWYRPEATSSLRTNPGPKVFQDNRCVSEMWMFTSALGRFRSWGLRELIRLSWRLVFSPWRHQVKGNNRRWSDRLRTHSFHFYLFHLSCLTRMWWKNLYAVTFCELFVSYGISNECLPIQLGMLTSMFNGMGNQFSHSVSLCLCLMECAAFSWHLQRGVRVCPSTLQRGVRVCSSTLQRGVRVCSSTPCGESSEDKGSQLIGEVHKLILWHLGQLQWIDDHLVNHLVGDSCPQSPQKGRRSLHCVGLQPALVSQQGLGLLFYVYCDVIRWCCMHVVLYDRLVCHCNITIVVYKYCAFCI